MLKVALLILTLEDMLSNEAFTQKVAGMVARSGRKE